MFNEIKKVINWDGIDLELSTGKIARQSDGAVIVKMADSVVLCTAVSSEKAKEDASFFPLTVHYREMAYAAGKIPGGFFKQEGKPSEREVLVSRLIDRPIRPLFHPSFFNETQVICTVLSYDPACNTDILAIIGASAALAISGVPYQEIVAASRVGLIDNKFVLNPSCEALKNSKLDLVVAGTTESVMMVESEADLLSKEQMLEAVKFGHASFQPVISMIEELVKEVGKEKWHVDQLFPNSLQEEIRKLYQKDIKKAFLIKIKQDRAIALDKILNDALAYYSAEDKLEKFSPLQVNAALEEVKSDLLRHDILNKNTRIDGRKPEDIRQIDCMVPVLPRTHGSSLFTRGETQCLVVTTLGTSQDEQAVEGLEGYYKEHFMLNYIFPPYSVGEVTPFKAPGRREIGHGKLAWRAMRRVLPPKSEFAYSIRVVSEVTECNGSSSMATICGTSMSLMDAGVPIKDSVAGIAMGLIKEGKEFVVLSDIMGEEDYLGDMDFKVAGTKDGITALQMDIKVQGITFEIMSVALSEAKDGILHILKEMGKAITTSNKEVNANAPMIVSLKINKDKIRDLIGPGGKIIKEICEKTDSKIDISDDGTVTISAIGAEKLNSAISTVKSIVFDPTIGDTFDGKVVKVLESGAFVNYLGNKDGFVHISEIADERIEYVSDFLSEGDTVKVKFIGFDNRGKARLTIKGADKEHIEKPFSPTEKSLPSHKRENSRHKPRRKPSFERNNSSYNSYNNTVRERKYFN